MTQRLDEVSSSPSSADGIEAREPGKMGIQLRHEAARVTFEGEKLPVFPGNEFGRRARRAALDP